MNILGRFLALSLASAWIAPVFAQENILQPIREEAVQQWEDDVAELDRENESLEVNEDAILFVGSSSIRRWESIAIDMAPYRPIERGYGGAKYSDLAVFAERIIQAHVYRGLVVFVANDIVGKKEDHTPEQVEQWARHIVNVSHKHRPGAPVFLIEVTPTESRFAAWDKIRLSNERLRELALTTPDTYFIATADRYLTPKGMPRPELFVEDKLHLSEEGYKLWGSIIRHRLDEVFRQIKEFESAK